MNQLKHKIIDLTMVKFTPQKKEEKRKKYQFFSYLKYIHVHVFSTMMNKLYSFLYQN